MTPFLLTPGDPSLIVDAKVDPDWPFYIKTPLRGALRAATPTAACSSASPAERSAQPPDGNES